MIQFIIKKYNFQNYLEIDCDKDQSFSKIKIKNKVGVDPISGGTLRCTSDDFFKNNKENFDIIFKDLKFKDYFYNYRDFMNIKSYDETLKLI